MEFKMIRKKLEKILDDSQNPIKIAYEINILKLNYYARHKIKAQLLFKAIKAQVCSKYEAAL